MRYLFLFLLILFCHHANSQCKTYRLTEKGDTLNCTDIKGLKQGKWKLQVAPLRGESGYDDEGSFANDKREGVWRRFNPMGDLLAIENYRWGMKNGTCRYFTIAGLEHEENWLAVNPAKAYDTIEVQNLENPDKYEKVVVKIDGHSLKHGTWKFYYPVTGQLISTERYLLDKPYVPGADTPTPGKTGDTAIVKKAALPEKPKPKEVQDFEKKNAGKKKVRIRDGRVGG